MQRKALRATADDEYSARQSSREPMPIRREDGFYVSHDLALGGTSVGIESDRLLECVDRITRDRVKGVFGNASIGFHGDDLEFLRGLPWVESVWFWDVRLRNVDGLYTLTELRYFGVSPTRPGLDFSRFPPLSTAVVQPRVRDRGLDACSNLRLLHVWRRPPKGKAFSLAVPHSLEEQSPSGRAGNGDVHDQQAGGRGGAGKQHHRGFAEDRVE